MSLFKAVEPMGIYHTLYAFQAACGKYMGDPGTHPWSQGFPLTTQLPGGPPLPDTVTMTATDRRYPRAWGEEPLRTTIASYYNRYYDAGITAENVMIFAGGRPGILAVLMFLQRDANVLIEETEYTPYWDLLQLTGHPTTIVPSNVDNGFSPSVEDWAACGEGHSRRFLVKSNPCNPTGRALTDAELSALVDAARGDQCGGLFDEAYEFFSEGEPRSAMQFAGDIDDTNIFVAGAVTKGLQSPGTRVGWVIGSKDNVRRFGNFSSFGMGGISRASQLDAIALFEPQRVEQARTAVRDFYSAQRDRYRTALADLGVHLFTGTGGFYHWGQLPGSLTADAFNQRLFTHEAAILPGPLCDMLRRGDQSPLATYFRFSFGAIPADSYDEDVRILRAALSG